MSDFTLVSPSLDAYWRAIILFGRNSATYKLALGKALLTLANQGRTFVSLEELAAPFAQAVTEHLKAADRQGTARASRFLDACRKYNQGQIRHDELVEQTVRNGFANVIDAFHVVNQGEIPERFFVDERRERGGIVITDNLLALRTAFQFQSLPHEVEARWRLVETAWALDMAPSLLAVRYDPQDQAFFVRASSGRRVDVTSGRDALNGYQKGKCFYCFADITIAGQQPTDADVDHFFPHTLLATQSPGLPNLDGIWNLVLACRECNRGPSGKMARLPCVPYLERLHRRNNYLIESHHPLRETLIAQIGATVDQRRAFLQSLYGFARHALIHTWSPKDEHEPAF